ncbi:hypothetical protein EJ05DRAFT_503156 [Pseudovirgaria hyperparasitica]|uniref:Uncharacterized protein n=1 Tax=Pseudovirgaria hyperparasitica TaxID=470096 RepID=A0A6A6W191_9PEZI|nr:uncharacterized protein EJ05DRAFT_503156 [Pseudovirgaria hyperparasitica]KAF2755700.1 hypothetical protein EJ05DRAFT_503156 [Pseudovirgaria hyperparasitica]
MQYPFARNLCLVFSFISAVYANTEKTIFIAPPAIAIPSFQSSLENLRLVTLSPGRQASFRTELSVAFPSKQIPRGHEHWYMLDKLTEGQRHEVRICWAATQPTEFWLDTYSVSELLETPSLISSLAEYSGTNKGTDRLEREYQSGEESVRATSKLFLRVSAAADFYTTNATLMHNPPDVVVDIILDPFALNLIPESLLPVGLYIVVVFIAAWFVSGVIYQWLYAIAKTELEKPHKD